MIPSTGASPSTGAPWPTQGHTLAALSVAEASSVVLTRVCPAMRLIFSGAMPAAAQIETHECRSEWNVKPRAMPTCGSVAMARSTAGQRKIAF